VKVVRETEDAVSIYVTEADGSPVKFRPGQFLSVDVMVDGERLRRAYSLSSACVDGVPTHITVKRIVGGRVSNQLNDTISEGDELAVLGPSGSFIVEPRAVNQRHLVMIAGGSGITPIISILETVLRVEPHSRVTLIYGNRGWNDVIFRDRLQRLRDEFGDRLTVADSGAVARRSGDGAQDLPTGTHAIRAPTDGISSPNGCSNDRRSETRASTSDSMATGRLKVAAAVAVDCADSRRTLTGYCPSPDRRRFSSPPTALSEYATPAIDASASISASASCGAVPTIRETENSGSSGSRASSQPMTRSLTTTSSTATGGDASRSRTSPALGSGPQ